MPTATEQYEEALTAEFRRLFAAMVAEGCDEQEAEEEATRQAEDTLARRIRDGRERDAEDRYHVRKLFAAA